MFLKKNKNKNRISDLIKEAEEKNAIECYMQYLNANSGNWIIEECPINRNHQHNLVKNDSIPDGIISHLNNQNKKWIEVVSVSRTKEERKKIGFCRKGMREVTESTGIVNIDFLRKWLIGQISLAIQAKSIKRYDNFATMLQITNLGVLLITIELQDPFYDLNEHRIVLDNFDETVLFSLDCGNSSFDEILVCVYVMVKDKLELQCSVLADSKTMARLRERQSLKNDILQDQVTLP